MIKNIQTHHFTGKGPQSTDYYCHLYIINSNIGTGNEVPECGIFVNRVLGFSIISCTDTGNKNLGRKTKEESTTLTFSTSLEKV